MNVLSLFDGISCGQIALNNLNIKYDNYYASEIDEYAISVTQYNYPNTIQLGDVSKLDCNILPEIYLMFGGSPCTSFSNAGKKEGFGGKSGLFWEYLRILKEVKPKYFLLENVKMKKEWENIITEALGVEPIEINSSLVSAQNRVRLYWTNIPNITQPEDKHIGLIDILEDYDKINPSIIRGSNINKGTIIGRRLNNGKRDDYNKDIPIIQCLEVRATNTNKSNCLTTVAKDNVLTSLPIGRHENAFKNNLPFRYYTVKEYCRLQTIPETYFGDVVSESQIKKLIGNGWTVSVIEHIFSFLNKLI